MATISLTQEVKKLCISGFCVCQILFLGINRGKENILRLVGNYFLLRGFFLGLGREDLGTESTVLMAACNRSKGVLDVGMMSIVLVSYKGVYNDSPGKSTPV